MHDIIGKYYATDSFYVVGNTTSAMDLSSSFGEDNLLISVLSALFVILVLLFTFKSAGLPVLLIIVIQGSIWINFSVPYLQHTPLYFLGYLIVNSIQMGANIDYAIVISSHYTDLKKVMRRGRPSSQPERVVPDHLHLRLDSGIRRYPDQRPDHEPRYLRHRYLPGPRHDRFHPSGAVRPAADPDPGRHHHRAHEL